jgi:hypothetical protein
MNYCVRVNNYKHGRGCETFEVHSFCGLSYDRSIASSKTEFSTECDLVLPVSISSIFSFPKVHPVAAYVFFLVFPLLLSFLLSVLQWYVFIRQFLRKMWPIQLAFLLFIVCRYFFPPWLCVTIIFHLWGYIRQIWLSRNLYLSNNFFSKTIQIIRTCVGKTLCCREVALVFSS